MERGVLMYYALDSLEETNEIISQPFIGVYDYGDFSQMYSHFEKRIVDEVMMQRSIRYEDHLFFDVVCVWKTLVVEDSEKNSVFLFIAKESIHFIGESNEIKQFILQLKEKTHVDQISIGMVLHQYLLHLASDYYTITNQIENEITVLEDEILEEIGDEKVYSRRILHYRKMLLIRKRRLEQYLDVIDYLLDNNNAIYDDTSLARFGILKDRYARMFSQINSLLEYVTEVREAYQSEMDNKQNKIMSLFTVITSIFLPLTLIVGWYGMNFKMPEFENEISYPIVIIISISVVIFCLYYFKKKKWF